MAKSRKKKSNKVKRIGRFSIVMTDRVRLLLMACFVFGFLAMAIVFLWR